MIAEPSIQPGTVIGAKFKVLAVLGVGGMGAVYEIEHVFTRHHRALKLLHPHVQAQPVIVERFLREASAAGHIGNPHIVETFDAGVLDNGAPYLVMELLSGRPLAARFAEQRKMPLAELVEIVRQAAAGVQAAHHVGIIHRDLKPENLFLENRGGRAFVKILDFGISKFDVELTGAQGVTREGAAMGTPYYMPPEQVRGAKDLDRRADVYALGVILYEGAAGRRPFEAETLPHLSLLIHEGKARPLAEHRPDLPRAFAEVVAKAMHVDRDRRFASADELEQALASFARAAAPAALDATIAASELGSAPAASELGSAPAASELGSASVASELGTAAEPDPKLATVDSVALGRTMQQPAPAQSRRWLALASLGAVLIAVLLIATLKQSGPRAGAEPESSAAPMPPQNAPSASVVVTPTLNATPVVSNATFDAGVAPAPVVSAAARPSGGVARPPPSAKPSAGATRAEEAGLSGSPY